MYGSENFNSTYGGQYQMGNPGFDHPNADQNANYSYKETFQTPSGKSKFKPLTTLNRQTSRPSISSHGRPVKLKPLATRDTPTPTFNYGTSMPGQSPEQYSSDVQQNLAPCSVCGRNFATDRLTKHMNICSKTSNKKRKQFDSTKARTQGTELAQFNRPGKTNAGQVQSKPKNHWRQKHGNQCFLLVDYR